jgi:hypothetical protein
VPGRSRDAAKWCERTTAATLWLVTVIGLCFGGGQTLLGVTTTIVGLATLCGGGKGKGVPREDVPPLIDLHPGLCRGFEIFRRLIRQWRRWRNYGLPRHRFLRVPADAAPQMSRSLGSHHAAHDAKRLGFARYSGGTACRNVPGR